jgi:hypothetical protein
VSRAIFSSHTNPVLEWARKQHALPWARYDALAASVAAAEAFGGYFTWNHPTHPCHALTKATDDELDHASRVLERLVEWEGEDCCEECGNPWSESDPRYGCRYCPPEYQ